VTQAAEVSRRDRGGGLDFDPNDVSLTVFPDRVDLDPVLGAVMEQLGALPGPGQLPGRLHERGWSLIAGAGRRKSGCTGRGPYDNLQPSGPKLPG